MTNLVHIKVWGYQHQTYCKMLVGEKYLSLYYADITCTACLKACINQYGKTISVKGAYKRLSELGGVEPDPESEAWDA